MEILRALVRWGNRHRGDLLVLLFLALTGSKFLYNGPNVVDLDLYDESTYLYGGVQLLQQGLRDPSYGPFYALWYFLLSLASPDRVALFYLNFYVLATLTAVSLYLLLRSNQVPLWASWASALLLLLLNVNVLTSPHPSHLALVITLLSLAFASRLRALYPAVLIASLGALLSVYVRAEQGPIQLVAIALLLGMAVMRWRTLERRSRVALGALVVLLGLGFFSVTNPFVGDYNGAQRTFDAFTHHFAANQLTHNPTGQDPWTNNASVVPAFFPTARSLPEVVAENPSPVAQHVRWNVSALATNLPAAMFSFYGVTYPVSRPFLLLLLVPLALLTYLRRIVVRRNLAQRWVVLLFLACYLAVTTLATLVVMPRDDLLLRMVAFLLALLVIPLSGGTFIRAPSLAKILVVGLLLVAVVPSFSAVSPRGAPHVATLQVLRGLGIQKPVMMLTPDGYYGYYFDSGYQHRLTEDIHAQTFEEFMAADGINMIVATPSLRQDPRYASSGQFRQLLESPAALGFTAFPVPFTDHTVLVRQNLLSE